MPVKKYSLQISTVVILFITLFHQPLKGQNLIIDLSERVVAITAGFTGADVLLFGSTNFDGDIIIVVRGPQKTHIVRKKERVGGVWVNRSEVKFIDIPSFYAIAANRPIEDFIADTEADIHQIGLKNIIFDPAPRQLPVPDITKFSDALIRIKQNEGLYANDITELVYLGNGLFRTNVHFPTNVSVGTYGIDVYLFINNELVESQTTLLNIRKFGIEAQIFNFAHHHSLAYGVLAVIIAVGMGWLANFAFRKR